MTPDKEAERSYGFLNAKPNVSMGIPKRREGLNPQKGFY